ncbi:hypothetical protein N9L30_03090 [Burkholderiaceae bacterium]|nr:hypothetical protein [Burkholderiaceae bacterium]
MKADKFIVAMVHHKSLEVIKASILAWKKFDAVTHIFIYDNSDDEDIHNELTWYIASLNANEITLITGKNHGYGAALNEMLRIIYEARYSNEYIGDEVILFGNADVRPIKLNGWHYTCPTAIPVVSIVHNDKNQNPFLSTAEWRLTKFLLPKINVLDSNLTYYLWLLVHKFIGSILRTDSVGAVHGAMFSLMPIHLEKIDKNIIFDPDVFLYGEELFYARWVEKNGLSFERSGLELAHEGSVSTNLFKKNRKIFLKNWKNSINKFCLKLKSK